jgi:hypothetical protein
MMTLPVAIVYSRSTNEVDVSGNSGSLTALAEFLEQGDGRAATLDVQDPAPYEASGREIEVRRGKTAKVAVGVDDGGRLIVTGEPEPLGILAANIRDLAATGGPDEHLHVDYFPDHFYLDTSSMPAVFRVAPTESVAHSQPGGGLT